ncbi:hypothetical protein FZW96_00300 [Bacillus sp. BGMRC 2118]|nr:hypothetical protein FZW96_00300 [Bacillus sp. BGMRC 2118]
MSQFRGVILEGYSNAGKTSVLKTLKQMQANDDDGERSVIILGEHYSQILHEVNGQHLYLNKKEHLELLRDRVHMLKQLFDWQEKLGSSSRSKGIFFILERFHLNHRVAFLNEAAQELDELENELFRMGATCALLTISNDVVETRLQSRNPTDWLNKSPEDRKQACQSLLLQQEEYRKQAKNSIIPTIEINTDKRDWKSYAEQIYKLKSVFV